MIADLCAGVGGFHLAFSKLNINAAIACEIDKYAKITYKQNFPNTIMMPDITKMEGSDICDADILCAGFPCQAFSIAGHRRGFDDSRGPIFFDVARIAKDAKPSVIFLENVENLMGHDSGNTMKIILSTLTNDLGYTVISDVLKSRDYGMYQNRRRTIIVGFLNKSDSEKFDLLLPTKKPPSDFSYILDNFESLSESFFLKKDSLLNQQYIDLIDNKENPSFIYQFRRRYWREYPDKCPTLTANMGMGGHNVPFIYDSRGPPPDGRISYRKLTPNEVFKLQGFNINGFNFSLPNLSNTQLYKQAGNSVPVEMIYEVAKRIINAIS